MAKIEKEKTSTASIIAERINFGEKRLEEETKNTDKYETLIRERIAKGLEKPISPAYIKEQREKFRAAVAEISAYNIANHAVSEGLVVSTKRTIKMRDKLARKEAKEKMKAATEIEKTDEVSA